MEYTFRLWRQTNQSKLYSVLKVMGAVEGKKKGVARVREVAYAEVLRGEVSY